MMEALRAVEQLVLDKSSFEFREELGLKASHLVYDGRWFTPLCKSILAASEELAQDVNGEVVVKIYKGQVVASGAVEEVIQATTLEDIYETPFNIIELNGKRMCTYH